MNNRIVIREKSYEKINLFIEFISSIEVVEVEKNLISEIINTYNLYWNKMLFYEIKINNKKINFHLFVIRFMRKTKKKIIREKSNINTRILCNINKIN